MKKFFVLALVLSLTLAVSAAASAGVYEGERVRIVIGSTATNGDSYMVAETFNRYLAKYLKCNSKVDPVGANAAFATVADADPDGLTFMIFHDMTYLGVLFESYDEEYALENMVVGPRVGQNPGSCFAAKADLPYGNMVEIAEYLKNNPGEICRVAVEAGGVSHIGFVAFYMWAKETYGDDVAKRIRIIVGGSTDKKLQMLWDGNADVIFADYSSLVQYTDPKVDEQLRVKWVGFLDKMEGLELPVYSDMGIALGGKPFVFAKDFLVYLPKGTPQAVLDELDAAAAQVAADPGFIADMRALQYAPNCMPSAEAKEFIYAKREQMRELVEGAPSFDDLTE